jgi:DNA mismatch repair protein MutL
LPLSNRSASSSMDWMRSTSNSLGSSEVRGQLDGMSRLSGYAQ